MDLYYFICNLLHLLFNYQQLCDPPPMECPNENITYWLYTRTNVDNPHRLLPMDADSIQSAPWVAGAPIKILIHGYGGDKDFLNMQIRPAYMKCCDYNVISVDYNPIAFLPYSATVANMELVGKCTAQLIDQLVTKHSFDLQRFHVIGFSLGAHVAGYISNFLTSGTLERISGLDPAWLLFTEDINKKLDPSDAKYVDCLHTSTLETCGTSDWYANGLRQPGCNKSRGCAINRAVEYYAESINTDVGFYAGTQCNMITQMFRLCQSDENVLYGEWMSLNTSGVYFFKTKSESPYARGRKIPVTYDDELYDPLPMECPNENITYWLYTRANVDNPHRLLPMDADSIQSAPWVAGAPIKILIHGYKGNKDSLPNMQIRPAYMKCCDYNVISVDYNQIAFLPYSAAVANMELVGKCTAQLIDQLVTKHSFDLQKFHVIGFSLGAHVAGYISNFLTSGTLERISGLEPTRIRTGDNNKKLDPSDAKYVDCLHTSTLETCGTSDWYANGPPQPGCNNNKDLAMRECDYARSAAYYAESITTNVGFYGTKCHWIFHIIKWCNYVSSNDEVLYGEWMSLNTSGDYFFKTNSESPFARGRNKKKSRPCVFSL